MFQLDILTGGSGSTKPEEGGKPSRDRPSGFSDDTISTPFTGEGMHKIAFIFNYVPFTFLRQQFFANCFICNTVYRNFHFCKIQCDGRLGLLFPFLLPILFNLSS